MRNGLFAGEISPACEYCEYGRRASDNGMSLSNNKGMVSPYSSCRNYLYSPLKRIPKRQPRLPEFSPEEFQL